MNKQATIEVVKHVLGDDYLDLHVDHYTLDEDLATGTCTVRCSVSGCGVSGNMDVEGSGVGFIDAVFHAFRDAYAEKYPSLQSIRFAGFNVDADFGSTGEGAGTDVPAGVILSVQNSRGKKFEFSHSSSSITMSAMHCTLEATEYFVNTERAFVSLHHALEDAKSRSRSDLAEKYSIQLAQLVENTSYSIVIESLRNQR